jgi:predicted dehydrogenase
MKKKIGFIGLGRMGITHFSLLNSNPKVKITSACDPSKMVNTFFKKYIDDIRLYDGYEELLKNEEVDGVIVSTPPGMHFEIVKNALERNINVFVEKPFTLSYMESMTLSKIAIEKNLHNQVGYVNRFNDMFLKAKQLIEKGIIGKVLRFKSEMFSYTISKEEEGDGWRAKNESGGGCLNEMASHAIDLVNYIIGVPDRVSGSIMNKVYSKNVDDIISSTFIYKNGIAGTLYVNWCDPSYRKPANKLEIFGKEGKILVDQHDLKIFLKYENIEFKLRKGWNTIYITDVFNNVPFYVRGNEFTRQLCHFADCIMDKSKKNLCSFGDAAQTQKILDLIKKDYASNYGIKYGEN